VAVVALLHTTEPLLQPEPEGPSGPPGAPVGQVGHCRRMQQAQPDLSRFEGSGGLRQQPLSPTQGPTYSYVLEPWT
jgi:hypothetical protein